MYELKTWGRTRTYLTNHKYTPNYIYIDFEWKDINNLYNCPNVYRCCYVYNTPIAFKILRLSIFC